MVETLRSKLLGITLGDVEAEALVVVLAETVAEIKAKTLSDTLDDQGTYRHAYTLREFQAKPVNKK